MPKEAVMLDLVVKVVVVVAAVLFILWIAGVDFSVHTGR